MGKRSGVIDDEDGILALTIADLDAEIVRCQMRQRIAPNSYLRKSFETRIHWLEKLRARHPGVISN
jgi:hypothetical protein